jgi:CBS-domain-containing membrane protein
MLVNNLMTANPRTCQPNDNLDVAARIMWEADCGAVPVVDDNSRVIGLVTDRDICMAAYTQGMPLWAIAVTVAMAKNVITCRASDNVDAAESIMREARVRRLPVVDHEGKLVGMLSLNDLAREAVHDGVRQDAPQPADLAQTLAAICEPRQRIVATPAV